MSLSKRLSRRQFVSGCLTIGAYAVLMPRLLDAEDVPLLMKKIPSSGESIPAVGIGTARHWDVGPGRTELKEVLREFAKLGGKVIDTAPSYGDAEAVLGDLVAELGNRNSYFFATKLGTRGKEEGLRQIEQSFRRLRTDRIDLIQVHNLLDTDTQLATLREMKQKGRIRYLGVTTSFAGQHAELESVMKAQKLDFIQVDYALDNRVAAARILPLAVDRGIAVLVNVPFGRGRLFQMVQNRKLPDWAAEFDCHSWAQFFLKYLLSNPAVTCAIPGTAQTRHLVDNLDGARGRLPDAAMRKRMEQFIDSVNG